MYLGIDVGGTKTLVASFTNSGKLVEQVKFKTPKTYPAFIKDLEEIVGGLSANIFSVACVALPGRIDRKKGVGIRFGNLGWRNVPITKDLKSFLKCPVIIENDANTAGLSEALLVGKKFNKVLYITISTGIGTGIVIGGRLDPDFQDSEPGHIMVQYNDRLQNWEEIASGSAIKKRYGKIAAEINDRKTWQEICHRFAIGLNAVIATIQPDVVIIGGGVGSHFKKFGKILEKELQKYSTPLTPVPPLLPAKHAEEAVIFGCYQLAKEFDEKSA